MLNNLMEILELSASKFKGRRRGLLPRSVPRTIPENLRRPQNKIYVTWGQRSRSKGIWVRETGGNLYREKVPGNLCGEKVPGIFTGGGKGAGDGKRCREFVRPVGKGLVTGDYQ